HASAGIVDTSTSEIYVYGFHLNGLGRWLSSGLAGSVLDNANYNYDVGRAWPIDRDTFRAMKDWFERQRANPPLYTILGNNCFEWALGAAAQAGIRLQITSIRDEVVMYQNVQRFRLWFARQNRIQLPEEEVRLIRALMSIDPSLVPQLHFGYHVAAALRHSTTGVRLP
ncbi:MAG: hypothetical protein RMJ19_05720, partial [Gemmatales bacterium]|nr:hypothetical protein [Gemmatales bacterium]MDW8175150.1 hypothetical protein [Gemmatales bacterium]